MTRFLWWHKTTEKDAADQLRVEEADRRADAVRVRAERVATSLERRLRENHFAEGLGIAWGSNGQHRR